MKKKMKRIGILLAAMSLALSACSFGREEVEPVISVVEDHFLTVGILNGDDAYAHLGEFDRFEGIEPEILEWAAHSMGSLVMYREMETEEELMQGLSDGSLDIVAGRLGKKLDYENAYLSTRYYAKSGLYLMTEANRYTDTLAGFADAVVGVSGSIPSYEVSGIPYMNQVQQSTYDDLEKLKEDLYQGVIDAGICTEREAMSMLKEGFLANELLDGPKIEMVFYLMPGQTEVLEKVNAAINEYLDAQATGREMKESE